MVPKIDKKMLLAAWSCNNKYWVIHQAYHLPLREMFREVINFDPQEHMNSEGKEIMNKKFIDLLKKEKPDYIMLFLVLDEFYPETLIKIKEILPDCIVVQWNGDDDIKFDNYTVPYSAIIDYQFISQLNFTERYKQYEIPIFDTLGADIEKFKPLNLKKKYDVVFVGSPKGDRADYLRYLIKNNVNFVLFGGGWSNYPEFKKYYRGQVSDEDFLKIINETKINICFSNNYFSVPHVLERSLQVNACKSFALTGYAPGYFPKFTEGKDFATFKNKEELVEKINYYLKNEKERENIAERAYKKIVKLYSNQKMLSDAFKAIESDKRELHSLNVLKYMKNKPIYLDQNDFKRGLEYIKSKIDKYEYICFKKKGYEVLPYRDYFQVYSMKLLDKPISICNCYLSSKLIGDYATFDLFYAYNYGDRRDFYSNLDLSQFMVKKEFFVKNFSRFESFYAGKTPSFINLENTSLLSIPLIRTRRIKKIPVINFEHILFPHIDVNLVVLKNKKRLFFNSYIYKLIIYALFVNPQILKIILTYLIPRTKNKYALKISKFFTNFFN